MSFSDYFSKKTLTKMYDGLSTAAFTAAGSVLQIGTNIANWNKESAAQDFHMVGGTFAAAKALLASRKAQSSWPKFLSSMNAVTQLALFVMMYAKEPHDITPADQVSIQALTVAAIIMADALNPKKATSRAERVWDILRKAVYVELSLGLATWLQEGLDPVYGIYIDTAFTTVLEGIQTAINMSKQESFNLGYTEGASLVTWLTSAAFTVFGQDSSRAIAGTVNKGAAKLISALSSLYTKDADPANSGNIQTTTNDTDQYVRIKADAEPARESQESSCTIS